MLLDALAEHSGVDNYVHAIRPVKDLDKAFERVIDRARISGAPVVAALAAALAAERCQENGEARVAHSFADQASREYNDLGMTAAVRALHARLQSVGLSSSTPLALEVAGTATGIDPRMLDLWAAVRASQALAAELQIGPLISRLLGLARETAGAQRAVLISQHNASDRALSVVAELRGAEELTLREPLAQSSRVPVQLIERAMRAGDARVVHDAARDPEWSDLPYFRANTVRSALCVPIGQGVGALYLENSLTSGAFNPGRIEILRVLASQAAVSLQNAHLLEEEAEKDHLRREMQTAARIQQALVPTAPQIAGCEIAVHMTPADQVGGDYYDVLHAGGCDWFVIGDVCGHGLPAGLIMVICQTALHAVLQGQPDINPAQALSQINRVLKANLERFHESKYVAITLFRHLGDGLIEYAGLHEDLVIYRRATDTIDVYPTEGTWLGVVPNITPLIPVRQVRLGPADVLALYTDGVIDARVPDGSMWGRAGLERLLRDCGRLPLETIKDRIVAELAGYRKTDDITLVLLRREG
jgi:serine phosphatase RsbU (regulator of sigma subunit)